MNIFLSKFLPLFLYPAGLITLLYHPDLHLLEEAPPGAYLPDHRLCCAAGRWK